MTFLWFTELWSMASQHFLLPLCNQYIYSSMQQVHMKPLLGYWEKTGKNLNNWIHNDDHVIATAGHWVILESSSQTDEAPKNTWDCHMIYLHIPKCFLKTIFCQRKLVPVYHPWKTIMTYPAIACQETFASLKICHYHIPQKATQKTKF